jgi:hypothetical protein
MNEFVIVAGDGGPLADDGWRRRGRKFSDFSDEMVRRLATLALPIYVSSTAKIGLCNCSDHLESTIAQ